MEVKLDKQYPLDVDAERAWTLLTDLKAVAGCMPGAELTEQLGEGSYKGAVKIKVGPAVAQFAGQVDVLETVPAERKMVMRGKGAWVSAAMVAGQRAAWSAMGKPLRNK